MSDRDRDEGLEREGREPADSTRGRGWAIAGIVSGVAAALLIPILFGPLGVILGVVGIVKGSRQLGIAAVVVSVLCTIAGLVIGAILVSTFGGQLPQAPQQ